jgi:DNA modification methylase
MTTIGAAIEYQPAASLTAYARNARTHSADQVEAIAGSMREWGWTMPVLIARGCEGVEDGSIIAGHGRVLAAAEIYAGGGTIAMSSGEPIPAGHVPVVIAQGWTERQRRAYVIADNQLTLAGGWDESILKLELMDLREGGFDLTRLGFEDTELAGLLDVMIDTESDPEAAPEAPVHPVSRRGDVWVLGRHRLICGDATNAADVAAVLAGEAPHLMVTDPPYGVDYDPGWRLAQGLNTVTQKIAKGEVDNDDRIDWKAAWDLFKGDVAYVWHGGVSAGPVQSSLAAAGFVTRSQIIWVKNSLVIGRGDYHWKHEPCWYMVRKGATGHWAGDRTQSTCWDIQKMHRTQGNVDDGKTDHSTQKPLECMRKPMENNSVPGDAVYDPFVGSGTTLIAAEMSGRRCFALEINPAYIDVTITRWQNVTGNTAVHEASGQSFAMLKDERDVEPASNAAA